MKDNSYTTVVFMFTVGIIFILIAIFSIVLGVKGPIERAYVKNNGVQINAEVASKTWHQSTYSERTSRNSSSSRINYYSYTIKYEFDGREYSHSFDSHSGKYNEKDIITIYCLANNPNKVSVDIEHEVGLIGAVLAAVTIFGGVGILCVIKYNIFKYRRIVKVI